MARYSVVIPTRDRPDQIVDCVRCALLADDDLVEVIVVDQSETDESETRLERAIVDRRLRVVRSETRGVAAARNIGFAAAEGDVIVCTDDDCRVPSNWLDGYRPLFADHSATTVAYSTVVLPDVIPPGSFAAKFTPFTTDYHDRLPGPHEPWGISANMAFRRSCLDEVGYFDEALGAGGRFGSGAETDFTIRVVAAGLTVSHIEGPPVLHLGLRSAEEASPLARRYGFGLGAVGAKHLRLRSRPGWSMFPKFVLLHGIGAAVNLARRRSPSGAGFVLSIIKGGWASRKMTVDRETSLFVPPASASSP